MKTQTIPLSGLLIVLFVGVAAPEARAGVQTRETSACEGRQTPGPICETCELLSTCVHHSTGWVNIPVETCDVTNGYYCNARLGMCSNMTGPCHPFGYEGNFPCTSHGIFPDPYDCQKYHMCYFVGATLVSATVDCGNDKAYDPASGQCTLTLEDDVCRQKQFDCLRAGDAFAWPKSPNIFYVCKATSGENERVLYPTLYRCNDGDIFDGYYCLTMHANTEKSVAMRPAVVDSSTMGIMATEVDYEMGEVTETTINAFPAACKEVGLFADTEDCRKYFYCSGVNGLLKHMECPLGTYYNKALSSCTMGTC